MLLSFELQREVGEHSRAAGRAREVLRVYADHARTATRIAWLRTETVASEAPCGLRTVPRARELLLLLDELALVLQRLDGQVEVVRGAAAARALERWRPGRRLRTPRFLVLPNRATEAQLKPAAGDLTGSRFGRGDGRVTPAKSMARNSGQTAGEVKDLAAEPTATTEEEQNLIPPNPPFWRRGGDTDTAPRSGEGEHLEPLWAPVRERLRGEVSDFTFHIWLEPLELAHASGQLLFVRAPAHLRTWIRERHFDLLAAAARAELGDQVQLEIVGPDWTHDWIELGPSLARHSAEAEWRMREQLEERAVLEAAQQHRRLRRAHRELSRPIDEEGTG